MAVSTSYSVLTFNGNGATTAFSVTWPFFDGTLVVTAIDADGVETVKTITTHYTVSGGTDADGLPSTGTVTMLTAPASGTQLRITRSTPKTQGSVWTKAGAFSAKTLEAALDRLTLVDQEGGGAGGGTLYDGIAGDVMTLNSAGATDYWDGEGQILRGLAAGTGATDAVILSQLAAYTQTSFGLPTTATTSTTIDTANHIVMANPLAATITVTSGATFFWVSRSSASAADVTIDPPAGMTIEDNADGVVINAVVGPVGFIIDPADSTNYITFTPSVSIPTGTTTGRPYYGALTVAQIEALVSPATGGAAFATDGRKNGEGGGSGTGVTAVYDGSGWYAEDTGATLAA